MNSIFLLLTGDTGYDTYSAAILIAKNAKEAQALWEKEMSNSCNRVGFQSVRKIGTTHKGKQIVLTSFHAG